MATEQVKTGDTARLREGDLVGLGAVEEIHSEYAYVRLNRDSVLTSATIGTFETVDTKKEGELSAIWIQ